MKAFYSFLMLGRYGRLGNQMFQVAATACLAKKRNVDLVLPKSDSTVVRNYFDIPCVDVTNEHLKHIKGRWQEPHFSYSDQINDLPTMVDLLGYLQSLYYITDAEYVKSIFQFSQSLIDESKKRLGNSRRVALHVRRSDYIKHPNVHPVIEKEHYYNALEIIKKIDTEALPIVFTDDKEWCENNLPNFEISQGTEILDMCMMSLCSHVVIANSSFSWWAAWLGEKEDQIVIAPKQWFGPEGPHDWSELYKKDWKVI